jgi:serine/threonine protein kinase
MVEVNRFYGSDSTQPAFDVTVNAPTRGSQEILQSTRGSGGFSHYQFSPGDMIDSRYQVIGVIGRGGFGCVYKVLQVLLRKEFALKTLNPVNVSETTILRLRKEAQAASRLEHPNLVQAMDFGMIDGVQPFLVMDLVEGPTLAEYLKENGRLPVETALEIFIPLAQAIAYAHRQGVVHRDLKPSNVILAPDKTRNAPCIPKIVDFGIAKIKFSDESRMMSLTATGDVFGTPLYMSPEQCAGTGVDARSDTYSLGCMLFEALTGAPPFNGHNALEVMMQHGSALLPSLKEASLGETFAPELERIVSSMLTKLPEERYSDSQILADDLFWLKHGEVDRISVAKKPDAVESKRIANNKSTLYKVILGICCTVVGATIGYGAALVNRPVQAVIQNPNEDDSFLAAKFGSDLKESYVSSDLNNGASKYFFPAIKSGSGAADGHEQGWGTFHWWSTSNHHESKVIPTDGKPFSIPKNAKLLFRVGYSMGQWPYTWARFRHNDLTGIIIDGNMCSYNQTTCNTMVESFFQQDDLKLIQLRTMTLSPKSLSSLGYISSLRWLDLTTIFVEHNDSERIHAPRLTGKEIASFPNLPQLKVLSLEEVTDVSPVLARLSDENLKALSLAENDCTEQDIESIARFQNLEILNLRGCKSGGANLKGDKLVAVLMKLKKLKKLAVDRSVLEMNPENLRLLNSKNLTILAAWKGKQAPPETISGVSGAIIEIGKEHVDRTVYVDQEWMDSLKIAPENLGV